MTKTIAYLFIAGFFLLLTSCSDIGCADATEAYVKVSFYNYDTKLSASPDSITLYGVGNSMKIYNNQRVTPPMIMPLKNYDNETEFIIRINGTADTIRFVHSNFPHLISKECGYSMFHTIDAVYYTVNEIDSIAVTNNEVSLKNIQNVAIFY